jgi:DNA-binding LacI/PurR family transcriptional regulator
MKSTPARPLPLPQRLSLVAQTVKSLREGVREGHWQEHLPAERELCAQLQVSRVTLRAALQELEREGELEVTGRRGRRIAVTASKRRGAPRRHTVGLLMATPFQDLHSRRMVLIHAVRENLTQAGCASELHIRPRCFSAHPARALEKLTRDHPGTVWLVFGSREPMQRWFIEHKVPCLIIGSCKPGLPLPSIDVDHRAACRHAGNVLWRKGHRSLALALPSDAFDGDAASEQGLREALAGKPGTDLTVFRHDGSKAPLCAQLDHALAAACPPTAVIVARAIHALTVTMHLLRRGIEIPREIAVISRDDEPFLAAATPAMARYRIGLADYVRRVSLAARQLAETGALPLKAVRLVPTFVAGETV